jgi:MYXO-CTERM domain-containing protein
MKIVVSVAALLMMSGSVMAYEVPVSALTAQSLSGGGFGDRVAVVYTSIPGPYAAAAGGLAASVTDDFVTTLSSPEDFVNMRFVGGVTSNATGSNQLAFRYFDTSATLVSSFTVNFPQAGDFIWTINLAGSGLQTPIAGTLQISANSPTTTMHWYTTSTAPAVGSNVADSSGTYQAFETTTPAPASLGLLGLGGLVAARRRRN